MATRQRVVAGPGQFERAVEYVHTKQLVIALEVGSRAGEGMAARTLAGSVQAGH